MALPLEAQTLLAGLEDLLIGDSELFGELVDTQHVSGLPRPVCGRREGLQDYSLLPEVSLYGIDETEGQILVHAFHLHELLGSDSVKGFDVSVSRSGQTVREGGVQTLDLDRVKEGGGWGRGLLGRGGLGTRNRQGHAHGGLSFAALVGLAADVDVPACELGGEANV